MKNNKMSVEDKINSIYKTQFTFKTEGEEGIRMDVSGSEMGLAYKLAYLMLQLVHEKWLDKDSIGFMFDLVKDEYTNFIPKEKKEPSCTVVEVKGALAKELYETLQDVANGKIDEKDLNIKEFIKKAKEQQ